MTSYAYYVPICLYRLSITTQTGTESDVAAESFARNDVCHFPREPKYGSRNFRISRICLHQLGLIWISRGLRVNILLLLQLRNTAPSQATSSN
ncbi:unnamed protein product [Oikopleura dioica]|uniref:Uncharacterized protein n=1 Tax=Oikopleura dioica TaxID=34765 RepID=E4YJU5_OIKDI|nr:unnamed protein product [Oikopleura dioica]